METEGLVLLVAWTGWFVLLILLLTTAAKRRDRGDD
jgi:hypothetical protein